MKKTSLLFIISFVLAGFSNAEIQASKVRVVTHEFRSNGVVVGSVIHKIRQRSGGYSHAGSGIVFERRIRGRRWIPIRICDLRHPFRMKPS